MSAAKYLICIAAVIGLICESIILCDAGTASLSSAKRVKDSATLKTILRTVQNFMIGVLDRLQSLFTKNPDTVNSLVEILDSFVSKFTRVLKVMTNRLPPGMGNIQKPLNTFIAVIGAIMAPVKTLVSMATMFPDLVFGAPKGVIATAFESLMNFV
ncbi:uncharacterized protein LOC115885940 [Sitophilus oryzae]|uniref:Uncharacterized protein LOC115885940 n=1 Tax=Sitophilus oryzae TaxID=7048 RepID=A0A6J2YAD4_SITOR|nr:uncharacterized protein LOC115885940 [Sitophilus oryzae]